MNFAGLSTRRRFLLSIAGAGAAIGIGGRPFIDHVAERPVGGTQSCDTPHRQQPSAVRRSARAFGTTVSIEAWHAHERIAREAVDAAFGELELVEHLMSIYRPDSQLCRLNAHGSLRDPDPLFVEVVQAAETMSRRSQGAFDITVQPLWHLFTEAKKQGSLPSATAIEKTRSAIDWQSVVASSDCIRFRRNNTQITLNGIAQGFAADRAALALRRRGVAHAMIDAGELATIGSKPTGAPWSVGIQHPRHDDAYLSLAKLNGRCLATSGDYATAFSDDFRANHVFDPRTGQSPTVFASVSVAAQTAIMADALSTAVFVLGVDKGLALVDSTAGADALVVLKDGRTLATRGFPRAT